MTININDDELDFEKMGGLLPVVIQDYSDGEVLMVGFMNQQAWHLTVETGKVHYYSRKKNRIWMKGEQSGHFQHVREIYKDNDHDSLLIKVNQIGGAVEDGYRSCFYLMKNGADWLTVGKKIFEPQRVYDRYTENIVFAVPGGSLYPTSILLLERAGFELELAGNRSFKPIVQNWPDIKIIVARAQEIPTMVQEGVADIGLTGNDMVEETGVNVTDLLNLGYNKEGLGEVNWVLAVPKQYKNQYQNLKNFEGKRICTELPNIVRKFFTENKIEVQIQRSAGTTESKAPQLCDAIVDLCESGKSMLMNGLVPLYKIRSSAVHLIGNNESMGYGWKRQKIKKVAQLLSQAASKLHKNPKTMIMVPDAEAEAAAQRLSGFISKTKPASLTKKRSMLQKQKESVGPGRYVLQVGLIGSAGEEEYLPDWQPDSGMLEAVKRIGALLGQRGATIITGGGGGIMRAVAKEAIKHDAITVGLFNTHDDISQGDIYTVGFTLGMLEGGPEYILPLVSDAIIAVSGGGGTLNELTVAYRNKVPTVLLKGYGGWVDRLIPSLYKGKYLDERKRMPFYIATDPDEAVDLVIRAGTHRLEELIARGRKFYRRENRKRAGTRDIRFDLSDRPA